MASSEPRLPAGLESRPASPGDLDDIDALYRRCDLALGVMPESRRPFFSWWWSQSYMELERDTRVLVDGGRIVAVGMGAREDAAHAFFEASGRVDPEHVGRGLGTWLLAWLARAGVGRGASWVRNACPAEDGAAARLFRAAGYAYARTAWDMGVGLAGDEPTGEPLDGIEIRPYRSGLDDRDLWRVMTVSFRDHWDHEADPSFESFMASWFADPADPPVVWMATAAGAPVGEVAWIHVPEGAYVISVAVLPEHRRKGIATALLRAAIIDMAGRGIADVSLSVDSENPTGAVRAYERVGMTVRRTTHVYHLELA